MGSGVTDELASETLRVVIADDHPLFLEGVATALGRAPDIEIVGTAGDAAGAVRMVRELHPDLVLMDITMPGDGLQATREIAASCPDTRVLILTVLESEDKLVSALQAGAAGYALKGMRGRELAAVLRRVHAGEAYVAPSLAGQLLMGMVKPKERDPLAELTERERAILDLVATGLSNYEVGERLSLAEKTVKHYMTSILGKLQVRGRVEAALLAQRHGLGQPR
ncbi:MAG: response regulator transcription factor [Thermomicrobiales bacterium]